MLLGIAQISKKGDFLTTTTGLRLVAFPLAKQKRAGSDGHRHPDSLRDTFNLQFHRIICWIIAQF